MFRLLHQLAAIVIAVAIVWVAWAATPPSVFKDRLAARDPAGAVESLRDQTPDLPALRPTGR